GPVRVGRDHQRGAPRGVPGPGAARGHYAGPRVRERGRPWVAARHGLAPPADDRGRPLRPRRQGRPGRERRARPMTRLGETFDRLRARRERALIPYFTAGDPSLEDTRRLVREAARRGADIVELGVPFSDPLADGPVIPRAS